MAHQHLHLQEEFGTEQTREKQVRVSIALLGTLAGGVLLINSGIGKVFYGSSSFNTELFAMLGAILLGAPIIIHAIHSLIHGESHMDELAALGIVAAFATGRIRRRRAHRLLHAAQRARRDPDGAGGPRLD